MNKKARLNYIHAMSTQVEHKKMYKAKKQWIVAGLSFLVATGLGVVGGQLTTHADTTNISQQATTSAAPKVASGSSNVSNQKSTTNNSVSSSANSDVKQLASSNGIQHQAEVLHTQVVNNGMSALNKIKNTSVNNFGSSSVNNSASGNQNTSVSSASAKSSVVPHINSAYANYLKEMGGSSAYNSLMNAEAKEANANSAKSNKVIKNISENNPKTTNKQSIPQATDTNWIAVSDGKGGISKYISDGQAGQWKTNQDLKEPQFFGMSWKYNPALQAVEFTGGTLTWNGGSWNHFVSDKPYLWNGKDLADMSSIKFDNNVDTSHLTNTEYMFFNSKMKALDLGDNFDTKNVTAMDQMFSGASNLESLTLPTSFNTSSVNNNMSYMFNGMTKLQHLTLPSTFNTSHVTIMNNMFSGDMALQELKLPDAFDTSKVTNMQNMFGYLYGLHSDLTLPSKFNTQNVTNMNSMFVGETNLKTLNLGNNFNTSKVTDMSSMFSDAHDLNTINLGNEFNTSSVHNMAHMFDSDYSLQNLTLPNNFNTNSVSDMYMMFIRDGKSDKNSGLNLTLSSGFNTTNAKKNNQVAISSTQKANGIDHMFQYANINSITVPSGAKFQLGSQANLKPLYQKDSNDNYTFATPHDFTNSNNIGSFNDENIKASDIYSNVDGTNNSTLAITPNNNTQWAFVDANGKISNQPITQNGQALVAPIYDGLVYKYNKNNKSVEFVSGTPVNNLDWFISRANNDIKGAKHIQFDSDVNTNNVTDTSFMFSWDNNVQSIVFSNTFNTSHVKSMNSMFNDTNSLQSMTLPNSFDTSNVSDMRYLFNDGLKTLVLSNSFDTNKAMRISMNNVLPPSLQIITIQSPNTKIKDVPLGSWYPVATKNGQLEKDSNGKYITVPNVKATNLADSSSHVGTWVRTPNVPNVTDTIAFYNVANNDLVSKTTINGNDGDKYDLKSNSSLIPSGYQLVNAQGNQVSSDNFTINPNKFDNIEIKSTNPSTNTKANKDIPVAPTIVNDVVTYFYKNSKGQTKTIATKNINGQTGTSAKSAVDSSKNMPNGYQPSGNSDTFNYPDKNSSKTINIKPINKSETITYMNGSQKVASDTISGNDSSANGASDTTFDANSKMPNGYKLAKNQPNGLNPNKINYDGNSHTVNVEIDATNQTANISYKLPNGQVINGIINGKNGSDVAPTAPQGYHFTGNPKKYHFDPKNAGNEPSDNNSDANDLNIAPNTVKGTATINIVYHINGVKSDINGTPQKVSINGQYGDSDQIIYPVNYQPSNDDYNTTSQPLDINFNDIAKNGSNDSYNPFTTFTYNATEAPDLVIRYDDTTNNNSVVHSDTYTPSDLGIKPQDWVEGNTITLGTGNQGTSTNKGTNVINAPYGYHLEDNKSGFDYKNGQESITLEPNAQVSGHPVVLMTMPTGNVAPNNSQSNNNPAKPASNASGSASNAASISINSSELSSLAKDIGGDINVTVRPNVTNTTNTNTIDDTTLNSLASEVATNNQEISSLANKPTNTTNDVNYSYFDNLVSNGVDKLTNAINQDFKANLHNVHAQRVHKITVKRVREHIKWIMIMKPLKLYRKATLVGTKHGVKTLRPNHEITLNVSNVYKVHNHYVFKVNYKHHNYFITANHNYVRNAYLPLNHNIINRKVRVLNDVYGYRHKNHDVAKTYHKGFVGRIKNIVRLGHYNMTRIQLTNGLWISANKNFIKLV